MSTVIATLIALPYELARLPLAAVDRSLSTRLPETSAPRVVVDRALGSADRVAGTVLHNATLTRRGSDRLERSRKLLEADRLDREAGVRRERARAAETTGRRQAQSAREKAQEKAESGLAEADATEARGKRAAATKAAEAAETGKAAAADRAAERARQAEERKQRKADQAQEKKKAARREAKAERDDARETEKSAQQTRADAERLADLAETKKQKRRDS